MTKSISASACLVAGFLALSGCALSSGAGTTPQQDNSTLAVAVSQSNDPVTVTDPSTIPSSYSFDSVSMATATLPSTAASKILAPGTFVFVGSVLKTQQWDHGQIVVDPVDQQIPSISPQQAAETCTKGSSVCPTSGVGTISLGVATSPYTGDFDSKGHVTPIMKSSLIYQLVWKNAKCMNSVSRIPGTTSAVLLPRTNNCTYLVFVDAKTGATVFSLTGAGL